MRKRTKTFSVRLSEKEYDTLNSTIAKCGISKSAFVRMIASRYIPKPRPPDGYNEVMSELTEIGCNLYNISNLADNTGKIDSSFLKEQTEKLDKAI